MSIRSIFLCLMLFAPTSLIAATDDPVILVLGDSLSAGYGISVEQGWVALLQRRLQSLGLGHRVVNASISGETSVGGRNRLAALLHRHRPDWVLIELGANDGLRGISPQIMARNLRHMVTQAQDQGARVLLIGIRMPPNFGPVFNQAFGAAFEQVAREAGIALVPRLLEGVGERRDLMQDDGLHPRAEAQARLLDNVWSVLGPLLGRAAAQ